MWSAEELEVRINQAVKWLRERVQDAHAQGLVVGISGGVDSAVVAGLCKRAFPDNSIGVILPAESSLADIEDAWLIARTMSLKTIKIDLTHAHQTIITSVKEALTAQGDTFEEHLHILE